jgi:D-alanyl-D-alanine carboxypeptidase
VFYVFSFDPKAATLQVQNFLDKLRSGDGSPAAIGRVDAGTVSVNTASGLADTATGRTAKATDIFEIGSQTKMMTAVVALQLQAEGKLDLDRKAADYLEGVDITDIANADTATIRQLLAMKSGIPDYVEVIETDGILPDLFANPQKEFRSEDLLNLVRGVPAASAPDEIAYSNTNYLMLGKIIEALTNKPLSQVFEARIFKPLNMKDSELVSINPKGDGLHGYTAQVAGVVDSTFLKLDKFAEGGVVSTSDDMIKFVQALLVDQTLLPDAQLAEMKDYSVFQVLDQGVIRLGLGLIEVEPTGQGKITGFSGGTFGHASHTYVSNDVGTIVAINQNLEQATGGLPAVAGLIAATRQDPNWQKISAFNAASDSMRIKSAAAADGKIAGDGMFEATFGAATLKLPLDLRSVTTSNIKFADGSVLVIGDNETGKVGDDKNNIIDIRKDFSMAMAKDNQAMGLSGDDKIAGGSGNDRLLGGSGNDKLNGRNGNDKLFGGNGSDKLDGGKGADMLSGGIGNDDLWGDNGRDRLFGGAGRDELYGEDGNDRLSGGAGRDKMSGGDGEDIFIFDKLSDSRNGKGNRDVIYDYGNNDDRISVTNMDANTKLGGDQDFKFIGRSDFSGKAGELHYVRDNNFWPWNDKTIIEGDVNGDGNADFQIELLGLHKLNGDDFIL